MEQLTKLKGYLVMKEVSKGQLYLLKNYRETCGAFGIEVPGANSKDEGWYIPIIRENWIFLERLPKTKFDIRPLLLKIGIEEERIIDTSIPPYYGLAVSRYRK